MRLFFHVRAGADLFLDHEGCEVQDLEEAQEHIREVVQEFDVSGQEDWGFEVLDDAGRVVLLVPFASADSLKSPN